MRLQALLFTLILLLSIPASASSLLSGNSDSGNSEQSQSGSSDALTSQDIDELISTLESPEQRDEFLKNLRTLKKSVDNNGESAEESAPEEIATTLGIEDQAQNLLSNYEQFLRKYNLEAGLFEKSIITGAAFFIALLLAFLNRKALVAVRNYMGKVRDRYELSHDRFRFYARMVRYLGYIIIFGLLIFSLIKIWDLSALLFLTPEQVIIITSYFISIISIVVVGILIWELANAIVEYGFKNVRTDNSNRIDTLLPIVQNIMLITFIVLFTLVLLSELGINIMPLLAGAGVLGIAIGFGAQTMVKDFLSGFTVILEDLIQVGDVAKVGDRIGLVEKITIRKVQLRDLSGIVYTVPFGEISIVENWTKDFSFYLMDVGVAYRENTDEVIKILKEVDEDLRADENYSDDILEPLEVLGVDAFADSAVIIKARIKTRPIKQWNVGREFNRRMKIKFDEHNIEIPFPHQTIYFGEDKDGKAPPAQILLQQKKLAAEKAQEDKKHSEEEFEPQHGDRTREKGDNRDDGDADGEGK